MFARICHGQVGRSTESLAYMDKQTRQSEREGYLP